MVKYQIIFENILTLIVPCCDVLCPNALDTTSCTTLHRIYFNYNLIVQMFFFRMYGIGELDTHLSQFVTQHIK